MNWSHTFITAAIKRNDDFEAARLILIRSGRATTENAAFETWRRGPIEGQAIIQEWLDHHHEALEDHIAREAKP